MRIKTVPRSQGFAAPRRLQHVIARPGRPDLNDLPVVRRARGPDLLGRNEQPARRAARDRWRYAGGRQRREDRWAFDYEHAPGGDRIGIQGEKPCPYAEFGHGRSSEGRQAGVKVAARRGFIFGSDLAAGQRMGANRRNRGGTQKFEACCPSAARKCARNAKSAC